MRDDSAGFAVESFGEVVDISNDADVAGFLSKFSGGFDFGKHGTGLEITFLDVLL